MRHPVRSFANFDSLIIVPATTLTAPSDNVHLQYTLVQVVPASNHLNFLL